MPLPGRRDPPLGSLLNRSIASCTIIIFTLATESQPGDQPRPLHHIFAAIHLSHLSHCPRSTAYLMIRRQGRVSSVPSFAPLKHVKQSLKRKFPPMTTSNHQLPPITTTNRMPTQYPRIPGVCSRHA